MKDTFLRAAVFAVALFFIRVVNSDADFSTNALLSYLTGIPALDDVYPGLTLSYEHPAELAHQYRPYVEITGKSQEVLRSLTGENKNIRHGLTSFGVKYPLLTDRAGMYLSFTDFRSSVSWPVSADRFSVKESYETGRMCLSVFASRGKNLRAGVTTGLQFDSLIQSAEISGKFPHGFSGSLRYFSIPYDWGVDLSYEDITKRLYSRFRDSGLDGEITWSFRNDINITYSKKTRNIDTADKFNGIPDNHSQVWNGDGDGWELRGRKKLFGDTAVTLNYGHEKLSGKLELLYSDFTESQYMRGELKGHIYRFGIGTELNNVSVYLPDISYRFVSTNLAISKGRLDSWPFTPKQIEIFGDKTWTFSGKGSIVSDAGIFSWNLSSSSRASLAVARVHPDYRIRITTRDHFSLDPWDIIFGKKRYETDRTRYFDFAHVAYWKSFRYGKFSLDFGISQFIPLRHSEEKKPSEAPVPPSFPEIKFKKPEKIGGFSFEVKGKWML